jgi:hypothetical protein
MTLFEIFKGAVPTPQYQHNGPMYVGRFSLNDVNYVIQFIEVARNDQVHRPLSNAPLTDNTWFFSFAALDTSGRPIDNRYAAKSSVKVFSTIMQSLVEFVDKHDIDTIYYGCDANDLDKRRLYDRITTKYNSHYNWRLVGEEDASFFGGMKHLWYCTKI